MGVCSREGEPLAAHKRVNTSVQEEFRRLLSQLEVLKEKNVLLGNQELVSKLAAMLDASNRVEAQVSAIQVISTSIVQLNDLNKSTEGSNAGQVCQEQESAGRNARRSLIGSLKTRFLAKRSQQDRAIRANAPRLKRAFRVARRREGKFAGLVWLKGPGNLLSPCERARSRQPKSRITTPGE